MMPAMVPTDTSLNFDEAVDAVEAVLLLMLGSVGEVEGEDDTAVVSIRAPLETDVLDTYIELYAVQLSCSERTDKLWLLPTWPSWLICRK